MAAPGAGPFRIFAGVTAAVAALLLVLTQVVGGDGGNDHRQAETIRLEPVSYTPPDGFTESVAAEPAVTDLEPFPVDPASSGSIRSASADTLGLYGGSLNYASCDREQLVRFLEASPAKARAWVGALNADPTLYWSGGPRVEPSQIRDYVFELTPVILRADTWVTNHGYVDGRATPLQSVLQAGTAVLVDAYGVPRVKCYCGNPLLPPRRFRPVYRGPRWPGFDPRRILIVTRSPRIIDTFVLTNIGDGTRIDWVAGSERPATTGGTPTPTPSGQLTLPPDLQLGSGDVQVTLLWSSGDDLDLHVVDPAGAELSFASPSSESGGQLDHDDTAGCGTSGATHVENIFWPEGGAPSGGYQAFVHGYGLCGGSASFQLRVSVNGAVVSESSGTVSASQNSTPITFTI